MYLDNQLVILLITGTLPLIYGAWGAVTTDVGGFLKLRFLGVLFIWVGYHLAPWCAYYYDGRWPSFLLVPAFVNEGLLFSQVCMWSYLLGYDLLLFVSRSSGVGREEPGVLMMPKVDGRILFWLMVLSAFTFVINVGGPDEIWKASYTRGEMGAQVWTHSTVTKVSALIATPLNATLGCIGSLYILQEQGGFLRKVGGVVALLLASLQAIHFFSRGAGFVFILFTFLALRMKHRRAVPVALLAIVFAFFLGNTGLSERNNYNPGLGNFIEASITPQIASLNDGKVLSIPRPESIGLDAMAPFTRKVEAAQFERPDFWEMAKRFFINLSPLPSQIFPPQPIGRDLSVIMRTTKSAGITTPALAETYYVFGKWGALLVAVLGAACAFFEKRVIVAPGLTSSICVLLCFISLPIGLHSSVRAMTRPVTYAFIITFGITLYQRNRISRIVEKESVLEHKYK